MMRRIYLLGFAALLTLTLLAGCGAPGGDFGVRISFLSAELQSKVQTGHIAIFQEADGVSCESLDHQTYLSKSPLKIVDLPIFTRTPRRALVQELPAGENLIVFVLGQSLESEDKPVIAQGCRGGVNLTDGKVTTVEIELSPI